MVTLVVVAFAVNMVFVFFGIMEKEQGDIMLEEGSYTFILSNVTYYALFILLLNGFIEVMRELGPDEWFKILIGKYHNPKTEELIFCFIDLKSSTSIAEGLGHEKYSRFIKDCFHELTYAVIQTKAKVYQYVGDEVVLYWNVREGIKNSNCIRVFYLFLESLDKRNQMFQRKYDLFPEFKAGMDEGDVTITEVGDIKRDLAFHGDVLNTAARLEKLCRQYHSNFLTTGNVVSRLNNVNGVKFKSVGKEKLKGKQQSVEVFSITNN